jgi:hypothetical protein
VAWQERRYSPWLLKHEESLTQRRERTGHFVIAAGILVAVAEALFPWARFTQDISPLIHIGAAALILPMLYFMLQGDFRRKLQAFTLAMGDQGRRLFFLDPYLEPEEFALQERMQGALLLPTQRLIETALKTGASRSMHGRLNYYFKNLPSPTLEEDRMGLLSILHPKTAISWAIAIALVWALCPGIGLQIGTSNGLSLLPLLLPLYLVAARANSRFAFELALFNWLRLG